MYLIGFGLYVIACVAIALLAATMVAKQKRARWAVAVIVTPVVAALPFADEIVGYYQFERLCEKANNVAIHGTILSGEDLYTADGRWRIGLQEGDPDERLRNWSNARKALESYVRWDVETGSPQRIPAAIPVHRYEARVYEVKSGRLLAEWQYFATSGGWLSRSVTAGEGPLIVRAQCMPDLVRRSDVNEAIIKFNGSETVK